MQQQQPIRMLNQNDSNDCMNNNINLNKLKKYTQKRTLRQTDGQQNRTRMKTFKYQKPPQETVMYIIIF